MRKFKKLIITAHPRCQLPKADKMDYYECLTQVFYLEPLDMAYQPLINGDSDQIRSVAQSCPTLCDPMNRSRPGLPVHHQLPEFTQTHVH